MRGLRLHCNPSDVGRPWYVLDGEEVVSSHETLSEAHIALGTIERRPTVPPAPRPIDPALTALEESWFR